MMEGKKVQVQAIYMNFLKDTISSWIMDIYEKSLALYAYTSNVYINLDGLRENMSHSMTSLSQVIKLCLLFLHSVKKLCLIYTLNVSVNLEF